MTGLHPERLDHLLDLLKHAQRLDYLQHLLLVPLHPSVQQSCESIAQVLNAEGHCAPFVSQFAASHLEPLSGRESTT